MNITITRHKFTLWRDRTEQATLLICNRKVPAWNRDYSDGVFVGCFFPSKYIQAYYLYWATTNFFLLLSNSLFTIIQSFDGIHSFLTMLLNKLQDKHYGGPNFPICKTN
jgi:hypothetical protein